MNETFYVFSPLMVLVPCRLLHSTRHVHHVPIVSWHVHSLVGFVRVVSLIVPNVDVRHTTLVGAHT